MRILYITDIDFSSRDAPPIHVQEIINNLASLKNKIFLIGPNFGKINVNAETKYIPIINIPFIRGLFFNIKLLFILPLYVFKKRINLIYTRQSGSLITPALISKIFSIPYITEVNGNMEDELKSEQMNEFIIKICKITERYCYKRADKIISVTDKIKEQISKKYKISKDKIIVLENGVDSNKFKPLRKDYLSKDKLVGYVGNFASWQGLEYLIEAISLVKKSKKDVKCIIVGDGPEKKDLENLSKKMGLEKNILFKGRIDHNLIPQYINSFYLCVAPKKKILSRGGGSQFKMYEYASCGTAIIASKIPGTEFITKNKCGILVEPNNPQVLAEAIIKLLNDPKLTKEMGKNGRKAILNGHSWKNVAERIQWVIEDTIRGNKK